VAASLAVAALAGCDDQRSADKQVLKDVRESRSLRLKGQAKEAQDLLDRASQVNASAATKAHAKSLLAQAQVEAAIQQINDPKAGVEVGNTEISRLLWEIGSLGQVIRTNNTRVASYAKYNPSPVKALAQQQAEAATGAANKTMWFGDEKSGIPTLAAVTQQISRLQGDIGNLQNQIKALQTQQTTVSQQAAQAARAAESAQGRAGVDAEKTAAGLRKQSADLINQIDVLQAKVAPLQADLAVAQARQAALNTAIKQFQELAGKFDLGWKGIEQVILRQQHLSTAVYQGVGASEGTASSNSSQAKSCRIFRKPLPQPSF
jgi:chromosome segregation ATPase